MRGLFGNEEPEPVAPKAKAPKPQPPGEFYTCDQCHQRRHGKAPARLIGIAGRYGLAISGELQVREFCGPGCFWAWKGDNAPQCSTPPPNLTDHEFEL